MKDEHSDLEIEALCSWSVFTVCGQCYVCADMWIFSSYCQSQMELAGKTAIITGGNTGIGKETAKEFYKRGARVIIACRNLEKAEEAAADIRQTCDTETPGEVVVQQLDLNSLSLVRKSAQSLLESEPRIHLLINNAGVMCTPVRNTDDDFETHFGVNHLGHFLFTLLLLPRIIESAPARIVNVSSLAHTMGSIDFEDLNWKKRSYSHIPAYAQSKLANVMFTKELARRLQEANIKNVTTYSLHPGVISTELGRNISLLFPGLRTLWRWFAGWTLKTPAQGAQTTLHCALNEQAANETGLYYNECKVTAPSAEAQDEEKAKKLWEVSLELVGLDPKYDPFRAPSNK